MFDTFFIYIKVYFSLKFNDLALIKDLKITVQIFMMDIR
jgi:hypothetical protein